MSDTSSEWYGAVVEQIMGRWLARLEQRKEPKPNTATYNAAYEACEEVLATLRRSEVREVSVSDKIREIAETVVSKMGFAETVSDEVALVESAIREAVAEERKALREIVHSASGMEGEPLDFAAGRRDAKRQILAALDARDAEPKEGA